MNIPTSAPPQAARSRLDGNVRSASSANPGPDAAHATFTGGQLVVSALLAQQIDTVFTVPGESFLAVLDALYDVEDRIKVIICRHEANASHMAEAYGKLTNRPGICFVTRGPGASHAAIGIHTARQDSTPLIVFVGQVERGALGREAWQEIDYAQMFGQSTKGVLQIDDVRRAPELLGRAFHLAVSGRPGPVVVALPEDMLAETIEAAGVQRAVAAQAPARAHRLAPHGDDMRRLLALLREARKPVVVLGGGGWTVEACAGIAAVAKRLDLPVACAFRRQDLFDNRLPHYAGEIGLGMDPNLFERVSGADLVIAIGPRLGETSTRGYALFAVPRPRQTLVHVHLDAGELGRVYQADLMINADMLSFVEQLDALAETFLEAGGAIPWSDWRAAARHDYETRTSALASATADGGSSASVDSGVSGQTPLTGVDMTAVVRHVDATLPARTIVTNGAGNYTLWVQRFFHYRGWRTQLAPTSGAMGYGVPAAIAARLHDSSRPAVCFAGDGCFLMSAQELATARQYDAHIIVIVVDNGMYGSIRMHQENHYPGRIVGTMLRNPDFVQLAQAYGASAESIEHTQDFPAAFDRALRTVEDTSSAVIVLRTDPRALSPQKRLP